jgi:RNA polymerase sigma-70 factor, ECF subfamily
MDAPDDALLRSFLAGDRTALEELARRYEGPLVGLATGLLDGNRDMAADAIQETWLRVIRHGHSFCARSSFKTWLYRIAINQCRNTKRAAERATVRGAAENRATPPPTPDPEPLSDDASELRAHLRHLHPDRRLILLLCYHQGMTHPQAADILGLPLGTLKTRLHAALTELRARLHTQATHDVEP